MTGSTRDSPTPAPDDLFLHRAFLPIAALVGVVMAALVGLLWHGAERQDAAARALSAELVERIIADARGQIAREAKDYAWWNDAVRALVQGEDLGWADGNIGSYVHESFGYQATFVIDEENRTRYAALEGERAAAEAVTELGHGLERLLQAARAGTAPDEPVAVSGLLDARGTPVAAGASLILPENPGDLEVPPGGGRILLFVQRLDAAFWRDFGARFGLVGLRMVPAGDPAALLTLRALDGTALAGLLWQPHRPGAAYFRAVVPAVGLALVLVPLLAVVVLRRATLTLAASEARFRDVADASSDWIWETDAAGRLTFLSERFAAVTGASAPELLGQPLPEVLAGAESGDGALAEMLAAARPFRDLLCRQLLPAGPERIVRLAAKPVLGPGGFLLGHRGTATDVTREVEVEREVRFLALHDPLTGLPNRIGLQDRLAEAIRSVRRRDEIAAVICLDLDRFKDVNDTLGHAAGDLLIQRVAQRLKSGVRDLDVVARLGGDEFAVIQVGISSADETEALCRRLLASIAEPIELDGSEVVVSASFGVAILPHDGDEPGRLLQNADIALYRAKEEGRADVRFFEPQMDARLQERKALEGDLRAALRQRGLEIHYQPQFALEDRRLVGVEALLRWHHPERGPIPPAVFIQLAEETGLILPLGDWVLQEACRQATAWPGLTLSVNLSPVQFRRRDLVASVGDALRASGLAPERLELEITESVLLRDPAGALAILHKLKKLGVRISMDDFGTGYSSLSHLQRFPFDKLKIDKGFVQNVGARDDAAIVRAVVGLGRSLRLRTCAEGVETAEQLAFLAGEGCDEVQGFYFSHPLPAAAISAQYFAAAAPQPLAAEAG